MSSNRRKAAYTAAASAAVSDGPTGFAARVGSIPRLARDVMTGRYDGMSRGRLALMVAAVIYIVSPIDLIPEGFLSVFGLADDAMVAAWLIAGLIGATSAYRIWERGEGFGSSDAHTVPGYVVREDVPLT